MTIDHFNDYADSSLATKWHSHASAAATPAPHSEAEPLLVVGDIQLRRDGLQNLGHRGSVLHRDLARSHLRGRW